MLQLSREPHSDLERIRHIEVFFSVIHYDQARQFCKGRSNKHGRG